MSGHCGPWVLTEVLCGTHLVPWEWFVYFFSSVFWILHEPNGLPGPPDEKQSGQKRGSLNAVCVLRPGEHMLFHLVDMLHQLLGFQLLGSPVPPG